jgi:hypothetical protein
MYDAPQWHHIGVQIDIENILALDSGVRMTSLNVIDTLA